MTSPLVRRPKSSLKSLDSTEFAEPPPAETMSAAAIRAERLAREFELGYLSREGFEKLAKLLARQRRELLAEAGFAGILK